MRSCWSIRFVIAFIIVLLSFRVSAVNYTIHWFSNGYEQSFTEVAEGVRPVPPTASPSCDMESGYTFVGWGMSEIDGTTLTAPVYYAVSELPLVTGDATYYAVYRKGGSIGWTLCTSTSQLVEGGTYTFASTDAVEAGYVMGIQNSNNRAGVEWSGVTAEDDIATFTLGKSGSSYTFHDGTGYLYAASSSSNYLKTQADLSDNGKFEIVFGTGGAATITAQGSNSRNVLQWNSVSTVFSCYNNTQASPYLYVAGSGVASYRTNCGVPHTITYSANGSVLGTQVGVAGGTLVFPAAPDPMTYCAGKTFVGWYGSDYGPSNIAPSFVTSGTIGSADAEYKAVFAMATGGVTTDNSSTLAVATYASEHGWETGNVQSGFTIDGVTYTQEGDGNNGKYYSSDDSWRFYSGGSAKVSIAEGEITSVSSDPSLDWVISSDKRSASYNFTSTTKFTSIVVHYSTGGVTYSDYRTVCEREAHDVTFMNNGEVQGVVRQEAEDSYITLPSVTTEVTCEEQDLIFLGWSPVAVAETNVLPVLYNAGAHYDALRDMTLYAVYGQYDASGIVYVRATSRTQLVDGMPIAISNDWYKYGLTEGLENMKSLMEQEGKIRLPSLTYRWILSVTNSGYYTLTGNSGLTLGMPDANLVNDGLVSLTTDNNEWEITQWSSEGYEETFGFKNVSSPAFFDKGLRLEYAGGYWCVYNSDDAAWVGLRVYVPLMTYTTSPICEECTDASLTLSAEQLDLYVGKTGSVVVSHLSTATPTYASSDASVATVAADGTVTAGISGTTTITIFLPTDGTYCSAIETYTVTVREPGMDAVEWSNDSLVLELDIEGAPTVLLQRQDTIGSTSGNIAEELFFSKYFEANSENKMLGIYNGTNDTIDLSPYSIKMSGGGTLSLFGMNHNRTPGKIAPHEEIIIVRFTAGTSDNSARSCAEAMPTYSNWDETSSNVLQFGGRQSVGLYKNNVLIDVIGGRLLSDNTLIQLSGGNNQTQCSMAFDAAYNDAAGWYAYGDNLRTPDVETTYRLSTNRCLLVRKNDVVSGANAVAQNYYDATAWQNVCDAEAAAAFRTLGTEWVGFQIGAGNASTDAVKQATCEGLAYLGDFDYSTYYIQYTYIPQDTYKDSHTNSDGTYTVVMRFDTLACRNLIVNIHNAANTEELLASTTYQIPIIIDKDTTTKSSLFTQHGSTCKSCDVVVRGGHTLTKEPDGVLNDMDSVGNLTIYAGSRLVVPSGTNYTVKNLILQSVYDSVASARIEGVVNRSEGKVIHLKRINNRRWYWFTLPYECRIEDVVFASGRPAIYGTDWYLKVYDGASRAATQQAGQWQLYTGTVIQPGTGYILAIEGIDGHANSSLVFPMGGYREAENKFVPTFAYGATVSDVEPNHKGWNLVGDPYLDYYEESDLNGLTTGYLHYDLENATWEQLSDGGSPVPYITIPRNGGYSEYTQRLAGEMDLPPFISYFVQIDGTEDGQTISVNFDYTHRGVSSSPVRLRPVAVEPDEKIYIALDLTNARGEQDETTLVLSDRFTDAYEIGADLYKWKGSAYKRQTKPVLMSLSGSDELAFQAIPDRMAQDGVWLSYYAPQAGTYTFTLAERFDLRYVSSVILLDMVTGAEQELLTGSYSFVTNVGAVPNRFKLIVTLNRSREVVTNVGSAKEHSGYAYSVGTELYVARTAEEAHLWIYDALGHLVIHDSGGVLKHFVMPAAGTYFVRVEEGHNEYTLRTIIK